MKKIFLTITAILASVTFSMAANLNDLKWAQVCSGGMGTAWYSSDEAKQIADIVLSVQKNNGGWMKNNELHKLSSSELTTLKNSKGDHSCLDNYSTTQEMRFLAKVYQGTKVEKYREAFVKALNMILAAEFANGGWGQYWPLSTDKYSYQNYITFNDDLVINVLKILRDVDEANGDFVGLTDDSTREKCRNSFNKGIDMIIKCQVNDNGTKAAWCAQHDPSDLLPTEGRPHELPSISGYESASILSFLMSVSNPSKELQECIISAVKWLDEHKIAGKAIEDCTNSNGEKDRRVIDKAGSAIWGRFIQIGGESGKTIYNKLFNKLKERGKKRSYVYKGVTYTYTEEEIARASYDASKAYQPIYAIYDDNLAHLYYRFLYNYSDTEPVTDSKGCQVLTSLNAARRTSYQFLGSWCQRVINDEFPVWKRKIEAQEEGKDMTMCELSDSKKESTTTSSYNFADGFSITNNNSKGYGTGTSGTVKYSAGVVYTINIPKGMVVNKVSFYGYDNYDSDAYLSLCNGTTYSASQYVFPAKVGNEAKYVTHTIDFSAKPVAGSMNFSVANKQCCLIITLYCTEASGVETILTTNTKDSVTKYIQNGKVLIKKHNKKYNVAGTEIKG